MSLYHIIIVIVHFHQTKKTNDRLSCFVLASQSSIFIKLYFKHPLNDYYLTAKIAKRFSFDWCLTGQTKSFNGPVT